MKAPKDIAKDLPLKCKLQYNKNTIVRICKFPRRFKCQCQMFVYSGHALSYTKLVHRHATETEGHKYFK